MEWKIYEFNPGQEIIINRNYISYVVDTIVDKQKDNSEIELVIYKDWNKYKQIWDYHIQRTIILSFQVDLYKNEEIWKDMDCPNKKRYKKICDNYKIKSIIQN